MNEAATKTSAELYEAKAAQEAVIDDAIELLQEAAAKLRSLHDPYVDGYVTDHLSRDGDEPRHFGSMISILRAHLESLEDLAIEAADEEAQERAAEGAPS